VTECGTKTREEWVISAVVFMGFATIQQVTAVNDIDLLQEPIDWEAQALQSDLNTNTDFAMLE
jgi:hypothetical protein